MQGNNSLTILIASKLETDDLCIITVPGVRAHIPQLTSTAHFHSSLEVVTIFNIVPVCSLVESHLILHIRTAAKVV